MGEMNLAPLSTPFPPFSVFYHAFLSANLMGPPVCLIDTRLKTREAMIMCVCVEQCIGVRSSCWGFPGYMASFVYL